MLTAEGCAARRERLWKALPPCDVLIVGDPSHLIYFAGYVPSPFVFRTVESSALLILEPGRATLVGDDMLGPYLDKAFADEVVAPTWYDGQHAAKGRRRGMLVASALDRLAKISGKRIGIDLAGVPARVVAGLRDERSGLKFFDIGPKIRPMRRSKDADEIATIRRSVSAGEAAHAAALAGMKPGMTELDAYLVVQNAAIQSLGEAAIVYGDFASGPRTATDKGGPPTSRKIEPGDLLLLDFSVVVDGYRGDFTNTFAVGGPPTPRQRELFEACVAALEAGESALKPGSPARGVDETVRATFRARGLEHAFTSHSGHGLGLGHPEPPYFVPESDETIVAGDVVAIEPGLYIPGEGGMRFERNYLITTDGFETLSKHAIRIEP